MKDLRKISNKVLHERLKHLYQRVTDFELIIGDIKNPNAKIPLIIQVNNYNSAIGFLEAELSKRLRAQVNLFSEETFKNPIIISNAEDDKIIL